VASGIAELPRLESEHVLRMASTENLELSIQIRTVRAALVF
jgi:hypothetical protein